MNDYVTKLHKEGSKTYQIAYLMRCKKYYN